MPTERCLQLNSLNLKVKRVRGFLLEVVEYWERHLLGITRLLLFHQELQVPNPVIAHKLNKCLHDAVFVPFIDLANPDLCHHSSYRELWVRWVVLVGYLVEVIEEI